MRVISVLVVALLLSGCTWMRQELSPIFPPAPPVSAPSKPPPETRPPHRPAPAHAERPPAPPPAPQTISATPTAPPPPDYGARCRAMADNRADDARQLGANAGDLAKLQQDVYRDCMVQSVKPSQ